MRLGRGVFTKGEDTHTLRLKSELFDLRVGYANPPCLLGKRFSIQRALSSRIVEMCSRHSLASFLVALLTSFVKNSFLLFFTPHPSSAPCESTPTTVGVLLHLMGDGI